MGGDTEFLRRCRSPSSYTIIIATSEATRVQPPAGHHVAPAGRVFYHRMSDSAELPACDLTGKSVLARTSLNDGKRVGDRTEPCGTWGWKFGGRTVIGNHNRDRPGDGSFEGQNSDRLHDRDRPGDGSLKVGSEAITGKFYGAQTEIMDLYIATYT